MTGNCFQSNKMPFLALELPRILTFDMDKLGKHRRHHWKKRLKISKLATLKVIRLQQVKI